jgi:GTP-binding protein
VGFGYAEVPQQQRQKWSDFMQTYVSKRDNLPVLFHLVDSRHGPSADDERIMSEIGSVVREKISYVIVLTKSDKNAGAGAGRVSNSFMDSLRVAMKNANIKNSPVLLTSAETKLGRDDIWRYLKMAAEV